MGPLVVVGGEDRNDFAFVRLDLGAAEPPEQRFGELFSQQLRHAFPFA